MAGGFTNLEVEVVHVVALALEGFGGRERESLEGSHVRRIRQGSAFAFVRFYDDR